MVILNTDMIKTFSILIVKYMSLYTKCSVLQDIPLSNSPIRHVARYILKTEHYLLEWIACYIGLKNTPYGV